MDFRSTTLSFADKRFQVLVEMEQYLVFNRTGLSSQSFPIVQTFRSRQTACAKQTSRVPQSSTQLRVSERCQRILVKCFRGEMIHEAAPTPDLWIAIQSNIHRPVVCAIALG
jgi:hypothetical protein